MTAARPQMLVHWRYWATPPVHKSARALRPYQATAIVLLGLVMLAATSGFASADRPAGRLPRLPHAVATRRAWTIGVKCNFPPFGYIDTSGHHAGYDVDIAQEFSRLAFGAPNRVHYACVDTANRIPTLRRGKVDMIIATLSWSKARAKLISYSTPYFGATGRLLVRSSGDVSNLASLKDKTVVTTTGSIYSKWTRTCLRGVHVQEVANPDEALNVLKRGQANAFMFDDAYLLGAQTANPGLSLTSDKFLSVPWGIGVRKGDFGTQRWVDSALARMQREDDFYGILKSNIPLSSLASFADEVPRPSVSLHYPIGIDPSADCHA